MPTYRTVFTVAGGTRFPLDMLRYDACYPASSEDVAKIYSDTGVSANRPIKLVHVGLSRTWEPTFGRWSSFCWGVDPESVETTKIA